MRSVSRDERIIELELNEREDGDGKSPESVSHITSLDYNTDGNKTIALLFERIGVAGNQSGIPSSTPPPFTKGNTLEKSVSLLR